MSDAPPILAAARLTKHFGAFTAVRNVSFEIHPRQVLGVLGPNGAGKSTIVKMVTGLLDPSEGSVLFRGQPIGQDLIAFKNALGYIPEQPDLYGFLTGWEYLEMVATLRGLNRRLFREKASAMLQSLALYPSRDLPIGSYSKGMRQRIVLIAALMHNPELLILDEPFSGLDVTSVVVLRKVIELLAAQGKAILFSSPVLEQADRLCSHMIVLKRGSVAGAGSVEDLHTSFEGMGLEDGFMQLTEQLDVDASAQNIVAATTSSLR